MHCKSYEDTVKETALSLNSLSYCNNIFEIADIVTEL